MQSDHVDSSIITPKKKKPEMLHTPSSLLIQEERFISHMSLHHTPHTSHSTHATAHAAHTTGGLVFSCLDDCHFGGA